jgi:hypothetical protein
MLRRRGWRAPVWLLVMLALALPPGARGQSLPPPLPAQRNLAHAGGVSGNALAVVAHNGFLYVAAGEAGLRVLDLASPAAPALATTLRTRDGVFGLAVAGGTLYAIGNRLRAGDPTFTDSVLQVISVANPRTPRLRGSLALQASRGGGKVVADGTRAYVSTITVEGLLGLGGSTYIVDAADQARPRLAGTVFGRAEDIAVSGDYLYRIHQRMRISDTRFGLTVVNVADPAAPAQVAHLADDETNRYHGIALDYPRAMVAAARELIAFDLSDPSAPKIVARIPPERSYDLVRTVGDVAYVSTSIRYVGQPPPDELFLINLNPVAAPIEVGATSILGPIVDIASAGSYVYVAGGDAGITILRFTGQRTLRGRVADQYNAPIAGVTVSSDRGPMAAADATGIYTFTELLTGTHALSAHRAGYRFVPERREVAVPLGHEERWFTAVPAPVSAPIAPGRATTLTYTDTQGLPTSVTLPAAAALTGAIALTPTLVGSGGGRVFMGHAFELGVSPAAIATAPLSVSVHYSAADDAAVSDKGAAALLWWSGDGWQAAETTCDAPQAPALDPVARRLVVSVCVPGLYALFGPSNEALLPLVAR